MNEAPNLLAAAQLADHYIEIILSEEPGVLVKSIADQSSKDIVKSAKALAEFRQALLTALADQPLPHLEEEAEDESSDEEESEAASDSSVD